VSGGTLGQYGFHQVEQVASDLREQADDEVWDDWTSQYEANTYTAETRAAFLKIADLLDLAAKAWKDADWLLSGDSSEDNWLSLEVAAITSITTETNDNE